MAEVEIVAQGRAGHIRYTEGVHSYKFGWEFGGRATVVAVWVPTPEEWPTELPWAAGRRTEVLNRIVSEVCRQKCRGCHPLISERLVEFLEPESMPLRRDRRPLTTIRIQALRALDQPPDERWVEWAVRCLTEGFDTPSLRILAGLQPRFDHSETTRLLDRALAEMGVPAVEAGMAVDAYARSLVADLLDPSQDMPPILQELSGLCVWQHYPRSLMPLYLLDWARYELTAQGFTSYWKGADRSNIDGIVRDEARRWMESRSRAD